MKANLSECLNQLVAAMDVYAVAMGSELATRATELRIMAANHRMGRLDVIAAHMEATMAESHDSMRIMREVLEQCAAAALEYETAAGHVGETPPAAVAG